MSKRYDDYLEKFFDEKEIPYEMYEINHKEELHIIDTDYVIESIKIAPYNEKKTIVDTLRKIDFANGNVNHYLKFLAGALIKTQY